VFDPGFYDTIFKLTNALIFFYPSPADMKIKFKLKIRKERKG